MELDREGRIPLHYAALNGHEAGVLRLLRAGADPSLAEKAGFTPLHFAAQQNHAAVIRVLLAAGAEVDAQDRWGNTPLWRAVFNKTDGRECLEILLEAGADPDMVNEADATPRVLAKRLGLAELGVPRGPDPA